MVHFGEFLKTWSLRSNSVTRQVSFNWSKIGGKCQNWKNQMGHFEYFSNTVALCVTKKKSALTAPTLPEAVLHIKISASEAKSVTSSAAACSITARPNSSHWALHNTQKKGFLLSSKEFSQELSHAMIIRSCRIYRI